MFSLCFAMFLLCFAMLLLCFAMFLLCFCMFCYVFAMFCYVFAMCLLWFAMFLPCFPLELTPPNRPSLSLARRGPRRAQCTESHQHSMGIRNREAAGWEAVHGLGSGGAAACERVECLGPRQHGMGICDSTAPGRKTDPYPQLIP